METEYKRRRENSREPFSRDLLEVIPEKLLYRNKNDYLKQDALPSAPY